MKSKSRSMLFEGLGLALASLALLASLASCKGDGPTALALQPAPQLNFCSLACAPSITGMLGTVGKPLVVAVQVVDGSGRPAAGVAVNWRVIEGGGYTDVAASRSDSIGVASVNWTLDTIAKLDSLQASLASGATILATATGRPAQASVATKVSGDSQTVATGATTQPFVLKVTDRYRNAIANMQVAWSVLGGGSLSAITTRTDATGQTQVSLSASSSPGACRVVATLGVMPAVTFTATAR